MSDRNTRTVMIVGATSDIARALAHTYAEHGAALQLASRDHQTLQDDVVDLRLRHNADVTLHELDIRELETFDAFVDGLDPLPDVVICAVGFLGDQTNDQSHVTAQRLVMMTNYVGPSCLLGVFADRFERRGSGTLIGISSVAGDRGRAKNYIYGSAKAGFTAYLSGLRNRLSRSGVSVLTVKPGFVATRMTRNLKTSRVLTSTPHFLSLTIRSSALSNRNTIYSTFSWRIIMCVIRIIPESLFKRLSI